jgi:hypothetical protein
MGLCYKTLTICNAAQMEKIHSKQVFYRYCQSLPLAMDKHISLLQNPHIVNL